MAQPSHSLSYVCRSCRQALKTDRVRLRASREATRTFSSSQFFSKTLATFTPTSSRELDSLLNTWRNEVFLPSILSPHHQDLVYKQSRREILNVPPGVSVTVQTALPPSAPNASEAAEETIKLRPMNRFDRQNFKKSFDEITQELYKSPNAQAWDNLIPFLEGLRLARVEPYSYFLPRLARIASQRDVARWNTMLSAAAMSKRTGVTLSHKAFTRELVLGTFQRAVEGHFAHPEPSRTLERIFVLLDAPEHCGARIPEDTKDIEFADMRRDATVLAVQTTFAAVRAVRNSSAVDEDGSVSKCIQKLLSLEQANPGCLTATATEAQGGKGLERDLWIYNARLTGLIPLYAALALTSKVNMQGALGKEKAVQTHVESQKLLRDVESRVEAAKNELVRGLGQSGNSGTNRGSKDNAESQTTRRRGLVLLDDLEASLQRL